MSFTIETNNPDQLYMIMNMVSHVLPMGNICIKEDGLYISGLDTSHISYIELELDKDYFTRYEMKCDIKKNDITLGISMNELVKILKEEVLPVEIVFFSLTFQRNLTDRLIFSRPVSFISEYIDA